MPCSDHFRRLNPNYEMPVIKGSNPNGPPPTPYGNEDGTQQAVADPSAYLVLNKVILT